MIVAYVTGHGFGHVVRTAEVLRAIREREPSLPMTMVTSGPASLLRGAVPGGLDVRPLDGDVGVAQKHALVIDEDATVERWRAFRARWPALVEQEASWLRRSGARVVLGDIPPLAFEAASRAGLPSVALANFSWDWVYRHMAPRQPALAGAAEACSAAYGRASLLLQLPFAGDLSAFPRREAIPLVARRPRLGWQEARRRLGLPSGHLVLLSFGGLGLPGFDPRVLEGLTDMQFLTAGEWDGLPRNAVAVGPESLASLELGYQDLVAAANVVVSKPGYGIVSDAIGARTRFVYTERGDFPEYPILVGEMGRYLPCAHVSNAELLAGRLGSAVREVLETSFPEPPDISGAEVAARRVLEMAG